MQVLVHSFKMNIEKKKKIDTDLQGFTLDKDWGVNVTVPLAISRRFAGSSGLNLCSMLGESLIKRMLSALQPKSCFATGMGSDLGRNQKGTAEMRVMMPATM